MRDFKKEDPEYKRISRVMRVLANDLKTIYGYSNIQVRDWFNTSNIAFNGDRPATLFLIGKDRKVVEYINKLKMEFELNKKGV